MMAKSEIFIVFPVCKDTSESYYSDCINVVESISKIFSIENYDGYYDSENIKDFLPPTGILGDCYPNIITRFRKLMFSWGENWRKESEQEPGDLFFYYYAPINDNTFCEVTKRMSINKENSFLIINYDAFRCESGVIETKYNDNGYSIDVVAPQIKEIAQWFSKNRQPKRIYNWNPKHGENGRGAFPSNKGDKVSILMCSKDDVPDMLNMAFGEDSKVLYYYDCKHKKYIEFRQEQKQGDLVYHAFHLDCTDENRIPKDIKSVIDRLFKD